MQSSRTGLYVLLVITIVFGLLVAIFPLSSNVASIRPELLCLIVIYWVTTTSQQFGVLFAWLVGLIQGVLEGVVWGGHALALAIVAYICLAAYQRIKNYSIWHQTLWIFVLVGFHQVMHNWVQSLAGYKASPVSLILSAIVTALCWPIVYVVLHRIRSSYRLFA